MSCQLKNLWKVISFTGGESVSSYSLLYKNIDEIKIKGVTKTNLPKLKKLGIFSLYDLFYHFPRAYENRDNYKKINEVLDEEFVILKGTIVNIVSRFAKRGMVMVSAVLSDETGMMELLWFNNRYVKSNVKVGNEIMVYGKVKKGMKMQIINPEYKKIDEKSFEIKKENQILPIYPSTESLRQISIRKIIEDALNNYGYLLYENIHNYLVHLQ